MDILRHWLYQFLELPANTLLRNRLNTTITLYTHTHTKGGMVFVLFHTVQATPDTCPDLGRI